MENQIPPAPTPETASQPDILPGAINTETPLFSNPAIPPVNPVPPIASPEPLAEAGEPPKPKNKLIPVLVVVLIVVALGAAGLWAYQNYFTSPKPVAKVGTPAPIASQTPSDDLVNWQTYTNPSSTYSFKHPSGLGSDTGAAGEGFESIRFSYLGPAQTASGKTETEMFDGYSFIVVKSGLITEFDPKTEAEKQQTNSKEICQNVSEITKTTVDSFDAFQFSDNCLGEHINTFVSDGKNTYSITQFYGGENKSSYKTITDQILSTFKFLEAGTTPSSSPLPSSPLP